MITAIQATSGNRHIESLRQRFENPSHAVNWLVVAHDEPQMIDRLSSALSGESAVILQADQDTWDFAGDEFSETIEWALQQEELDRIVLVGHSRAVGTADSQPSDTPTSGNAWHSANAEGVNRLWAGAKRSNAQSQQAREVFAGKIQQLLEIPVVHNRWSNDELAIYGLFFQTESGVFLAYDIKQESFRPLLA